MFRFPLLLIATVVITGSFASKVEVDGTSYLQSNGRSTADHEKHAEREQDQKDTKEGVVVQSCKTEKDKEGAVKTCSKYFTDQGSDTFKDCVFDVCAGGGEISVELAADVAHAE
eukprot:s55_g10.t1